MGNSRKAFDWSAFVLGVLLIILGFASLYHVDKTLKFICVMVGIGALAKGIYELWLRNNMNRWIGIRPTRLLWMAILDILLGLLFLFFHAAGVLTISYIFAIWFIIDCVGQLSVANFFKDVSGAGRYWFMIILNVLGIVLGVVLLFNPLLSAVTLVWLIATFVIICGVLAIAAAF